MHFSGEDVAEKAGDEEEEKYSFRALRPPSGSSISLLLCLLGDIAESVQRKKQCYQRAWQQVSCYVTGRVQAALSP